MQQDLIYIHINANLIVLCILSEGWQAGIFAYKVLLQAFFSTSALVINMRYIWVKKILFFYNLDLHLDSFSGVVPAVSRLADYFVGCFHSRNNLSEDRILFVKERSVGDTNKKL
jgi:hypothetical protein